MLPSMLVYWINLVPWAEISFEHVLKIMKIPLWMYIPVPILYQMITPGSEHDVTKLAGQRFKGKNGQVAAATKIQATWRMYKLRTTYIWTIRCKECGSKMVRYLCKLRAIWRLRKSRQERLEKYRNVHGMLARNLKFNWPSIKAGRR